MHTWQENSAPNLCFCYFSSVGCDHIHVYVVIFLLSINSFIHSFMYVCMYVCRVFMYVCMYIVCMNVLHLLLLLFRQNHQVVVYITAVDVLLLGVILIKLRCWWMENDSL